MALTQVEHRLSQAADPHYSIYMADCFEWLAAAPANSVHAVVTDPPFGLVEYAPDELAKLKNGKGGVWRMPPSFTGTADALSRASPCWTRMTRRGSAHSSRRWPMSFGPRSPQARTCS